MPPTEFKPRLHVLLARDAPVGVVIRRGPSKRVCTVLWDRTTDEFRLGQWLRGKIFPRRSDISPDGAHLIYFAMNAAWESETKGSWTAVSRTPYLKALALYAKGDGWHGGGLFTGNATYWLNEAAGHSEHTELRRSSEVARDRKHQPDQSFGAECLGVYYPRLMRDGWSLVDRVVRSHLHHVEIFAKPGSGGWTLRKIAHGQVGPPQGKGCYWDEHELRHPASNRQIAFPDWEWAEIDRDRLVWATDGKLFAAHFGADGPVEPIELFDLTDMPYQAIKAPY